MPSASLRRSAFPRLVPRLCPALIPWSLLLANSSNMSCWQRRLGTSSIHSLLRRRQTRFSSPIPNIRLDASNKRPSVAGSGTGVITRSPVKGANVSPDMNKELPRG